MAARVIREKSRAQAVDVWYLPTADLGDADMDAFNGVLSNDERATCTRMVIPRDRRDRVAAHALKRHALSRYAGRIPSAWRFDSGTFGKPSIVRDQQGTPPIEFSLSHTRGLVACAVTRGAGVGVDVEGIVERAVARDLARRVCTVRERERLETAGMHLYAAQFTELWTLKEAYVKAIGRGVNHPLGTVGFRCEGEHGLRFEPASGHESGWHFMTASQSRSYRMACAVHTEADEVHVTIRPATPASGVGVRWRRWSERVVSRSAVSRSRARARMVLRG